MSVYYLFFSPIGTNSLCAVNLINDGLTVSGRNVTVDFTGVGLKYSEFACRINGRYRRCKL